jgi:hypothetical protein
MRTVTRLYDSYAVAQAVVRDLENAGVPHDDLSIIAQDSTSGGADSGYVDTSVRDRLTENVSDRPSAGYTSSSTGVSNLAADTSSTTGYRGTAEISEDRVGGHETPLETTSGTGLGGGLGVDSARPPNVTDSTLAGDYSGGGVTPAASAGPDHAGTEAGAARGATAGTVIGGGLGLLAGIGALAIPGVGPVVAAGWLVATLTGAGVGAGAGGLIGALTGAGMSKDESDVYAEGVRRGNALVSARVEESWASEVEAVMDRHAPLDWQERRRSYGSDWRGFDPGSTSTTTTAASDAEAGTRTAMGHGVAERVLGQSAATTDIPTAVPGTGTGTASGTAGQVAGAEEA